MKVRSIFSLSGGSTIFVGEVEPENDFPLKSIWKLFKNGDYIEEIPIIGINIPVPPNIDNKNLKILETNKAVIIQNISFKKDNIELILE